MIRWQPIPGHPDLERADDGRVRRIPTLGVGLAARPHPTKRVVLSADEVAALRLGLAESTPSKAFGGKH